MSLYHTVCKFYYCISLLHVMNIRLSVFFFFFKQKTAYEIFGVTGVQTCALPICITVGVGVVVGVRVGVGVGVTVATAVAVTDGVGVVVTVPGVDGKATAPPAAVTDGV